MKKIWNLLCEKSEYIAILVDIILAIIAILFVEQLKMKILILMMCIYGVSRSLQSCFSDLGLRKCERGAEVIYKALSFLIIIGGSIVVLIGVLGDSGF